MTGRDVGPFTGEVTCAFIGEDYGRCRRAPASPDGMCATHTTHTVVTEHGQPMPTPNDRPALWPMVIRGYQNSVQELERYVEQVEAGAKDGKRALLRELYLLNMMQVATIARIRGIDNAQVVKDMEARHEFGTKKYKTALQPFNGRDALKDAYDELLDGQVYLRQALYEDGYEED